MFVVNKKHFNALVGFTILWTALFVYTFFGLLFWMGVVALRIIMPFSSNLYAYMSVGFEQTVTAIWLIELYGLSVVCLVGLWYCSIRLLLKYADRKKTLGHINRVIGEISSLSVWGGSISYTFRGRYGSATTEVVSLGGRDYQIKSTYRNAAGIPTTTTNTFRSSSDFFASTHGSSEAAMNTILGTLLVEKEYGIQGLKAEKSL